MRDGWWIYVFKKKSEIIYMKGNQEAQIICTWMEESLLDTLSWFPPRCTFQFSSISYTFLKFSLKKSSTLFSQLRFQANVWPSDWSERTWLTLAVCLTVIFAMTSQFFYSIHSLTSGTLLLYLPWNIILIFSFLHVKWLCKKCDRECKGLNYQQVVYLAVTLQHWIAKTSFLNSHSSILPISKRKR